MDWFRMYAEFASDPKVQSMPEAMQRRLMMIFCLRCSNTLVTLQETEIAFALRISDADLAETKALFISKNFVDADWNVMQWDKRQFVSDSSAPRVARHRAKEKAAQESAEVMAQANGNVTVTAQNRTDTDTDTEQKAEKKSAEAEAPVLIPDWMPMDAWTGYLDMRKAKKKVPTARALKLVIDELTKFHAAGQDIAAVLDKSTRNSWTDVYAIKSDAQPRASPQRQPGMFTVAGKDHSSTRAAAEASRRKHGITVSGDDEIPL